MTVLRRVCPEPVEGLIEGVLLAEPFPEEKDGVSL